MFRYFNPPCWIYVIASDHLFSASIEKKVSSTKYKVFCYDTGEEFFQEVLYNMPPKGVIPLVVVDFSLVSRHHQEVRDGLGVLEEIKIQQPTWTVLTAGTIEEKKIKNEALRNGAFAHVFKNDNAFTRIDSVMKQVLSAEKMRRSKVLALWVTIGFVVFIVVVGSFMAYFLLTE